MMPVQIRLFLIEHVIVILTFMLIELPYFPTKNGLPVIRWTMVWG
jgi:hypothetical protein